VSRAFIAPPGYVRDGATFESPPHDPNFERLRLLTHSGVIHLTEAHVSPDAPLGASAQIRIAVVSDLLWCVRMFSKAGGTDNSIEAGRSKKCTLALLQDSRC
jgi:hypothetical protein